jgi:exodeoxyribonuclease X-like protein
MTIAEDWRTTLLSERQQQELKFTELYLRDFGHGAIGHNLHLLVGRLTLLLDVATGLRELPQRPAGGDLVLTFGKYRDQKIADVWMQDPSYIEWLAREGRDQEVRAAAAALLVPGPDQLRLPEAPEQPAEDLPF